MAEDKKKPKKPKKLKGIMAELENLSPAQFARQQYAESRAAGSGRRSALAESVGRYRQTSEAMRTLRTGKKGGVGDFFTSAGFENLGVIAGALFDKKASKEEEAEAKKTLGIKEKEEKTSKESTASKADRKKLEYVVNLSKDTSKRIRDIQDSIVGIEDGINYIKGRVSPKIVKAKQKGGEGRQFVQYDPLAPAGEQFRRIGDTGKVSAMKPGKDYMGSATMQAALMPSTGAKPTGFVSRFTDPKEASFTEEFKRDPILLLRKDMNDNFEKVFELLEEQKKSLEEMDSGGGPGLGGLGSVIGTIGGRNKKARTPKKPKAPKPPKAPGVLARTATKVGVAMTAASAVAKAGANKITEKIATTSVGKAAGRATEKVKDVKSKTWTRFLKFLKVVSPKLYEKVATRLATAGGLAFIPGFGWIGSAITVLGSAWLAYDLYQLWSEFSDMDEKEQEKYDVIETTAVAKFGYHEEDNKRGGTIPSQSGAVEGAPGGTRVIPSQSGAVEGKSGGTRTIPSQSGAKSEAVTSTPFFDMDKALTPFGSTVPSGGGGGGGGATIPPTKPDSGGITPPLRPAPQKVISDAQGKKVVLKVLDKRGVIDPMARAAIMAQIAHESQGFTRLSENLKYSSSRLQQMFGYYRRNPAEAQADAGNEVAIGSKAYGNRLGNGPPSTGEGYEYRGRGFIQLTGKENYQKFGISNPDQLLNPEKAAENAVDYMLKYKGNWSDVQAVTRHVNGERMEGLDKRASYFSSFVNDPEITAGASGDMSVDGMAPESSIAAAAPGGAATAGAPAAATPAGGGISMAAATAPGVAGAEQALVAAGLVNPSPGGASIPSTGTTTAAPSGGLGDESITKEQSDALLGIIAQNKAAKEGISVEEAKAQLSFTPTATAQPVQTVSGQGMDTGSKLLEFGKSALSTVAAVAPMVVNNNQQSTAGKAQQGLSILSALGEAATRSSESAFSRAIAKDFSHPTAFTTIGTI